MCVYIYYIYIHYILFIYLLCKKIFFFFLFSIDFGVKYDQGILVSRIIVHLLLSQRQALAREKTSADDLFLEAMSPRSVLIRSSWVKEHERQVWIHEWEQTWWRHDAPDLLILWGVGVIELPDNALTFLQRGASGMLGQTAGDPERQKWCDCTSSSRLGAGVGHSRRTWDLFA